MRARHLAVLDAAVPVLVAAVVIVGEFLGDHRGSDRVVSIALGVVAAAVLWTRRRWPGATLVVSGMLVAVLFHLDSSAGVVAMLAPAVALYSLALTRGRRTQALAGTAAVGAVILADALTGGSPTILQTLGHVLLVSIPLLAAEVIRGHKSYVQVLRERLALAERSREQEARRRAEQERLRIARELHDVVAHTLTEVNVQAAAAAEQLEPGPARVAFERIEDASHRAIGELRAVLGVLRGPEHAAAPRLPAPGLADIRELVDRARATGLDIGVIEDGEWPAHVSEASSLAAYRIVQESLTNARRHAPGAPVSVTLCFYADQVTIAVETPHSASFPNGSAPGVGIQGMLERATSVGGTLRTEPTSDGFTVRAELPYQPRR